MLKSSIYYQLNAILDNKIETAKAAISSAKEARDSDTKSSAGDKYETGRAMMQLELEKGEAQLENIRKLKKELTRVDLQKKYTTIQFGSLVYTDQGNYFFSIGLGKIEVGGQECFALSLASPIGQAFRNKTAGDKVTFQDREITITRIA